jgi:DNA-binding CsgD family transcriptional regulator
MTSPSNPTRSASDRPYWHAAETVCTPKEIQALELVRAGMGELRAALTLNISRRSLRDRIANADRKIHAHLKENAA